MSKINFTRRTFLEKEEIARFQQFLADSPSENAIIGNTSKWGILRTDFQGDTDFLVEPSANAGRVKIAKQENKALTSEGLRIYQEAIDGIEIPNDNLWYWLRIKHKYVNWEVGTLDINQNGEIYGSGTKFLQVLRGQGTQVPVKVKFVKLDGSTAINSGFYEVVDVTDDENAILTSAIEFVTEFDLRIVVVGTTPIGETVTVEQEQGIYSYDSCEIEIVAEDIEDQETPPSVGFEQDKMFYIARVKNNAGFVEVDNSNPYVRSEFWEFNVVGLTDKLSIFNNLSDLTNADTALSNLGLTTAGRNIAKINPTSSSTYLKILNNGQVQLLTATQTTNDLIPTLNSTYLRRNQNLADLTDIVAARTNLNIVDEVIDLTSYISDTNFEDGQCEVVISDNIVELNFNAKILASGAFVVISNTLPVEIYSKIFPKTSITETTNTDKILGNVIYLSSGEVKSSSLLISGSEAPLGPFVRSIYAPLVSPTLNSTIFIKLTWTRE